MDDLALASRVKASLVLPSTDELEVDVVAHQGHVEIRGKVADLDQFHELERTARAVRGVATLDLDAVCPPGPD